MQVSRLSRSGSLLCWVVPDSPPGGNSKAARRHKSRSKLRLRTKVCSSLPPTQNRKSRGPRCVSGFCSIRYEIIWLRLGVAQFGVTGAMVSIILSMFMAGLGLGSWISRRACRRFGQQMATRQCVFMRSWSSRLVFPRLLYRMNCWSAESCWIGSRPLLPPITCFQTYGSQQH